MGLYTQNLDKSPKIRLYGNPNRKLTVQAYKSIFIILKTLESVLIGQT